MPIVGGTAFSTAGELFSLVRSLLNDADLSTTSNITSTGAVRSANIVTITTATAHGLVIGDRVQVATVTDATFNGTFTVLTVPTTTTFTYAQIAANASSGNGTVELLIQGDVFTDTMLLPLANSAYRKVQRRLGGTGSKTATTEIQLTIIAAGTELSDTSTPALPIDFIAPRELFERVDDSTSSFTPMFPRDILPSRAQSGFLRDWSWREDAIWFVGATQNTEILLRYIRSLANFTSKDSPLLIRGGLDAVAYPTATLAAASRGASAPGTFNTLYEEAIKELLNIQAHAGQYKPVRRRPYNVRRGYLAG